ncbi:MAG: DUF3540 domain-containing protein [Gammaproteobacteria bacterium]|nr:DUF3540 domain-containing protein [Gammaproteobacteria bacterium]
MTRKALDRDAAAPAAPATRGPDAEYVSELLGLYRGGDRGLGEATVTSWAEDRGTLDGGRPAAAAPSCLLRPRGGDRVRCRSGAWVRSGRERSDPRAPAVLAAPDRLSIEAPRVSLQGEVVQVAARDFLSCARNRHAVENTRTESSRLRVSQIGTDIRKATVSDERVTGALLQRVGTWISTTAHEARLKARTFLFE